MSTATYAVQLLQAHVSYPDAARLREQIAKRADGVRVERVNQSIEVTFADGHRYTLMWGAIPEISLKAACSQSWDWPSAAEACAGLSAGLWVTELDGTGAPQARIDRFFVVLMSTLAVFDAVAVHWMPAGKVVAPGALQAPEGHGSAQARALHTVNVRAFAMPHGRIMDTLGLAAFGLPDLQMSVGNISMGQVAEALYGLSLHMLEQGLALYEGESIDVGWAQPSLVAAVPVVGPRREALEVVVGAS